MAFIDDAFFELPDVATEGEAEGGGSQSQYSQQSQGGESEGSQNSQGSHNSASRRRQSSHNRRSARQFMDRLRLELLLGHRGTETSQARAGQDNDDSDEGARSDDEETPDRAAEPGPSEQPPETGGPSERWQPGRRRIYSDGRRRRTARARGIPAAEEAGAL